VFLVLLFALITSAGCFDYRLKVGYVGVHKKLLLMNDPEALAKLNQGRLRSSPSPSGAVIQVLEPGTKLVSLRYSSNWYNVKTDTGRTGWIYQSEVYRIPVYNAIYSLRYSSDDNHALIVTLPLLIILLCAMFFIDGKITRTFLLPVLILLILINATFLVGTKRAQLDRNAHSFRKISEYLTDKPNTVYATDYLWTNRVNFWTGYTRNFSYYYSSKVPGYNRMARIRTLRTDNAYDLHGVYVIVDPSFFDLAENYWELPGFVKSGAYPGNWRKVLQSGNAMLFYAQ
jgi:uncharacterized protein YgiM (DUF1202 family)